MEFRLNHEESMELGQFVSGYENTILVSQAKGWTYLDVCREGEKIRLSFYIEATPTPSPPNPDPDDKLYKILVTGIVDPNRRIQAIKGMRAALAEGNQDYGLRNAKDKLDNVMAGKKQSIVITSTPQVYQHILEQHGCQVEVENY
jgi:hypothetical protein